MKTYKIIIIVVILLLLFVAALLPTIYSKSLISFIGNELHPYEVERIYGKFDVDIENPKSRKGYASCHAYRLDIPFIDKEERYLVIKYYRPIADEAYTKIDIYEGTDWIPGGQK